MIKGHKEKALKFGILPDLEIHLFANEIKEY